MKPNLKYLLGLALVAFVLIILTPAPVSAQVGRLYGFVTDEEGNPIHNAEVYLVDLKTNAVLRPAKTKKKNGRYLYMAAPGPYFVVARKEGLLVAQQVWDYTDGSGAKNKFTWFFDEKQELTKKVRIFSTGDLTSKVDQRIDFVMTTEEKFTEVVNKLYAIHKGIDTETKEGEPGTEVAKAEEPQEEKKAPFEEAIDLLARSDFAGAMPFLQLAVAENPEDAEMNYQLGKAALESGDMATAETGLKKAKELDPTKPGVSFHMARMFDKKHRKAQAVAALEQELDLSPESEPVLENLGRLQAEIGQKDKAIITFEELIDINPEYFDAYIALANIHKDAGDKTKEEDVYKRMGDRDPTGQSFYNLGTIAFNRDDREKAQFYYARVLEKDPKHALAHYQLGNTLLGIGDMAGAVEHFEAFIKLKPRDAKAKEAKITVAELKKLLG
jgi:tetratricopeptide (TPR) repeat protein